MNYYERHIGDYLKDTAHLSLLEHGVYSRLLDVYYTRESAIPSKDVMRLVGARSKDEKAAVQTVLAEFFVMEEHGDWVQLRCEREIRRYQDKSEKARASINARWAKSKNERNTNVSHELYERTTDDIHRAPVPSNQAPVTNTPPTPRKRGTVHEFPPGFEAVWSEYPRKVGKDAAAKAFAKRKPDAQLIEAMVKAIRTQRSGEQWTKDGGQFIPHLATWLNQGRWMDEQPSSSPVDDIFRRAL